MEKKINAIHVGLSGFPFGNASINKCLAVYNILITEGISVLAINNKALHTNDAPLDIKIKGMHDNLHYQYTTPSPYIPNSFFKRRYFNFIGRIKEFFLILNLVFNRKVDVMFYYPNGNFFELVYYRIFSKLFNFPLISHYVEYRSVFKYGQNKWTSLNYNLFDKYFMRFVDGIFPISELLINHIKIRGFKGDYLKIPPLFDFNMFKGLAKSQNSDNYFLYAGSLVYEESINLILDSFELVEDNSFYLYLILNGSSDKMIKLKKRITEHKKKDLIKIYSNLEYNYFLKLLFEANALLIPLNDRVQDKARFPQKISEYTATSNPIISTNYGEIKYYFKDNLNALIAEKDSPLELSIKMSFIVNFPNESKEIGLSGYRTGLQHFDSNNYGYLLRNFVLKQVKNH